MNTSNRVTARLWLIAHFELRALTASILVAFSPQPAPAQFTQEGPKLVGTGAVGYAEQGYSVSISGDGNTAIIGGLSDNSSIGAAWIFTRGGGVWTQQGPKLVGTFGVAGGQQQGQSVGISGDGNTAIVGGLSGINYNATAWIFTRTNGVWTQQGDELTGNDAVGGSLTGVPVSLSADGNTAIVGGPGDNLSIGAAWVFTRSNGVWAQQGTKLIGTGAVGPGCCLQGYSVALSGDGNTAIIGGPGDNNDAGAVWVFTRSNGAWTQQGNKLVGTGAVGNVEQGFPVAMSADGNTALVSGIGDSSNTGAVWVFTRSNGVWSQQGDKLVATGANGPAAQGRSVALSSDGNTAIVSGPNDSSSTGAVWVFTRSSGIWTQQQKLVGTGAVGAADQGVSVALSGDGQTIILGGPGDNSPAAQQHTGAAWVFVGPTLQVTPASDLVATSNQGAPPTPSSFQYQLSATAGSVGYSISGVPNWLTPPSSTSGMVSSGTTVTFTVNATARSLPVGTYGPATITFANTGTGYGTQTRMATLTVYPPAIQVGPTTGIMALGTHGGPFSPSSFRYSLSSTFGALNYSIVTPSWLTASPESGTVTTSSKTINFTINSKARGLQPDTYVNSFNLYNTTNNQGNTTRIATLIVNPKGYTVTVRASPAADGSVSGGGTVAEGSSHTVVANANPGHAFVQWTDQGKVVSRLPTYAFTMPSANVTLVADFR